MLIGLFSDINNSHHLHFLTIIDFILIYEFKARPHPYTVFYLRNNFPFYRLLFKAGGGCFN